MPRSVLAAGVALALAACARHTASVLPDYFGTPLDPPKPAYDFVLTDGNGRPAHVVLPKYRMTFLFFGYTHCPDECPLALDALSRAYAKLSPRRRAQTRIVFVSVDPERDTSAVVGRYVSHFDRQLVGLTGTREKLAPVWDAYGVTVDPRSKEIGHGDAIYGIEDGARVVLVYPPDASAAELASDAAKLLSTASTSPSTRERS